MRKSTLSEKKIRTGKICALRLETNWEIIQCCLTFKGYKEFGPADLRILYDAIISRGGEIKQNVLYMIYTGNKI